MAFYKEYQCVIIGTTHFCTKFNIFRTKDCCPLCNAPNECVR